MHPSVIPALAGSRYEANAIHWGIHIPYVALCPHRSSAISSARNKSCFGGGGLPVRMGGTIAYLIDIALPSSLHNILMVIDVAV